MELQPLYDYLDRFIIFIYNWAFYDTYDRLCSAFGLPYTNCEQPIDNDKGSPHKNNQHNLIDHDIDKRTI